MITYKEIADNVYFMPYEKYTQAKRQRELTYKEFFKRYIYGGKYKEICYILTYASAYNYKPLL